MNDNGAKKKRKSVESAPQIFEDEHGDKFK